MIHRPNEATLMVPVFFTMAFFTMAPICGTWTFRPGSIPAILHDNRLTARQQIHEPNSANPASLDGKVGTRGPFSKVVCVKR